MSEFNCHCVITQLNHLISSTTGPFEDHDAGACSLATRSIPGSAPHWLSHLGQVTLLV